MVRIVASDDLLVLRASVSGAVACAERSGMLLKNRELSHRLWCTPARRWTLFSGCQRNQLRQDASVWRGGRTQLRLADNVQVETVGAGRTLLASETRSFSRANNSLSEISTRIENV